MTITLHEQYNSTAPLCKLFDHRILKSSNFLKSYNLFVICFDHILLRNDTVFVFFLLNFVAMFDIVAYTIIEGTLWTFMNIV